MKKTSLSKKKLMEHSPRTKDYEENQPEREKTEGTQPQDERL